MKKESIESLINVSAKAIKNVSSSKQVQKFLCGTYSDGTVRCLTDAMNDEIMSPSQKKKKKLKKKMKKANNKNMKKKKKNKMKNYLDFYTF